VGAKLNRDLVNLMNLLRFKYDRHQKQFMLHN